MHCRDVSVAFYGPYVLRMFFSVFTSSVFVQSLTWFLPYRAALPAWILTVILFKMVVSYGALMLSLTGACLTTAAILWATIRNGFELSIPFDPPEKILTTHYGVHWYLALILGKCEMVKLLETYVDVSFETLESPLKLFPWTFFGLHF